MKYFIFEGADNFVITDNKTNGSGRKLIKTVELEFAMGDLNTPRFFMDRKSYGFDGIWYASIKRFKTIDEIISVMKSSN
jgi:hypothetical protein